MKRHEEMTARELEVFHAMLDASAHGCRPEVGPGGRLYWEGDPSVLPERVFRILRTNGRTICRLIDGEAPPRRKSSRRTPVDPDAMSVASGEWEGGEPSELRALLMALKGRRTPEAAAARDILQHALIRADESPS